MIALFLFASVDWRATKARFNQTSVWQDYTGNDSATIKLGVRN
jgi:hypothetical protein